MSALQKRFTHLLSVLSVLAVVAVLASLFVWWQMRGSRAQLDGTVALKGLGAPVKIERDALGVPTITGASRTDVARATGFVHAQDRFFQMDLLRRTGAGELAEIFGEQAVAIDRSHRLHGFRHTAEKALAALPPEQRAMLAAYTDGVNAGLTALAKTPWEYLVLRVSPQAWRAEDSLLVGYAMWFALQESNGRREIDLRSVREHLGQKGLEFFAPLGDSWDTALDGSTFPAAPFPPIRLKPTEYDEEDDPHETDLTAGSNAFTVDGTHTATGAALLANDTHLNLSVPNNWYRAQLVWTDAAGITHRVIGVTLPGAPAVIIGSNQHLAWGFTSALIDTSDVVLVEMEPTAQIHYRTDHGWMETEQRREIIKVKGEAAVTMDYPWTEWGPIIGRSEESRAYALRWNAHDASSMNMSLMALETAISVNEGVAIAHQLGMPNHNINLADASGAIAWTLTGTIPRRVGYTGREPVSWAFGDRSWQGWLPPAEIPTITNPASGVLWSANQRTLGGDAFTLLGDGGYANGARARLIRDDLQQLIPAGKKVTPADLLAIQLNDRAVFLERWQKLLLEVLSDETITRHPALKEMRTIVSTWNGHASVDSAAYRIVRAFRQNVANRVLTPFFTMARVYDRQFSFSAFHYEDALWKLIQEKPIELLNPAHKSWDSLLVAMANRVQLAAEKQSGSLAKYTWGERNTLRMRHPFSSFLPDLVSQLIDLPATPLPGDDDMPRVQGPDFGASLRMVVSPGHEAEGIFHMPGGQSGHPLSPFYQAGHDAWVKGEATPLLPGATQHTLMLQP